MEEFEAVDWYAQRVDATHDEDLRGILAHNRDEEKEHAAMVSSGCVVKTPTWTSNCATICSARARSSAGSKHSIAPGPRRCGASFHPRVGQPDGSLRIGSLRKEGRP